MDAKKSSPSITRKISKRACRSSSRKMKRSPCCPVPTMALDNSLKKKSNFECNEASDSFRDTKWSSSYKSSCQLEAKHLKHKAGNNAEGMSHVGYESDEADLQNRNFKTLPSADETIVRYLNDQSAIEAIQNLYPFFKAATPTRSKGEKTEGSREGYAKLSLSITIPDAEAPQLAQSSASSSSNSSTHRLTILKHRQYDAKLEKLREQIRKQWGFQEDPNSRGQFHDYVDYPVEVAAAEKTVTPKVRKAAAALSTPEYKGFNPSEARLHTPDEKEWQEEELCRNLECLLKEEKSVLKRIPAGKRKKKKASRTVRKVQKVSELPGHHSKPGRFNIISTSSWRDGKRLAMKILGPAPKVKKQPASSSIDGSYSDISIKSESYMRKIESDSMQDGAIKSLSKNPKRSWNKMRRENNLRNRDAAVQDIDQRDHHINKDLLSADILDVFDNLQIDSTTHAKHDLQMDSATHTEQDLQMDSAMHTKQDLQMNSATHTEQDLQMDSVTHTEQDLQMNSATHTEQDLQMDSATYTEQDPQIVSVTHTKQGLQMDSVIHAKQETNEENQNSVVPAAFMRRRSPTKKKTDKLASDKEPEVICKKRHYDTDKVRHYIFKQRQERKKKQCEQKKTQKEVTLQRNKRLKELYKKQREALTNKPKSASAPKLIPKQPPETDSRLSCDQTLLKEPQPLLTQDIQPNPGCHPSEDSKKEGMEQGHLPCVSSISDMSLSEPHQSLVRDNQLEPMWIRPDSPSSKDQLSFTNPSAVLSGGLLSQSFSMDHRNVSQKDFDSLLSTRRCSTAIGFSTSPPVTSPLQPTMNQSKNNLDRIEALKATAASLSSKIEREARRLAGIGMDYGAAQSSGHNSVERNQGDGYWAKGRSPPVREENNVFSAMLQNMVSICVSQSIFGNHIRGLENPGVGKTISPHDAATVSLPCKQPSEGIVGNISKKQNCAPNAESIVVLRDCSVQSIRKQQLSDHLLSEGDGNQHEHSPLKLTQTSKEKEFCVAGVTGDEPIEQFPKEAENSSPISAQGRSASGPWEESAKGSSHGVINIFAKPNQLCGQGSEEWSGQGSPVQRPSLPLMSPPPSISSYEDDFILSQGSGIVIDKKTAVEPSSVCSSIPSLEEECIGRTSPYELQIKELTNHSSGTPSLGSWSSSFSNRREEKESTGFSLWEENQMVAESDCALLEPVTSGEQIQNPDSDNTSEELSDHSLMGLPDKIRLPRTASCPQFPSVQKEFEPVAEQSRSSPRSQATILLGPKPNLAFLGMNFGAERTGAGAVSDSMHFSPVGFQHQILAELHYLSTIKESLQRLSDMKRMQGISLVQQESVSLAQLLAAPHKQHERDLALLKLKAEGEALERQKQLKEVQQKAAQLTEIACAQNPDAVTVPANPVPLLVDQKQEHRSTFIKEVKAHTDISRKTESVIPLQNKEGTGGSKHTYSPPFDSCSESSGSKAHDESSSSHQESPFVPCSKETEEVSHREKSNSSIEEEGLAAVNSSLQSNSIPSIPDERDSTSLATEYSLQFDFMTEDEMEEKSFRSLLPSESHRRINLKKQGPHGYPDQEASSRKMPLSSVKELSLPFSGGQDSFSRFTMEMVRQYTKEEEMRAAHQSFLLQLHKRALKEKTKAELAWLEHQGKQLRHKGEDDKMPPVLKKKHGLILKLKQETAEIKRLQEAYKVAQKERQLILKQQEEIEQICETTMKLQEKLKSTEENKLDHCSEDDAKQALSPSTLPVDAETYSPSAVFSRETLSIMQKLKKMHNQADKKFLTKREQILMQRRQHAEDLLQWKCRLDAEEDEVHQIERQVLAAWDKKLLETKVNKMAAEDQHDQKETASKEDSSAVESGPSKVSEVQGQLRSPHHTALMEEMVYMKEIESSALPGNLSPKSHISLPKQGSSKQTHRAREQHLPVKSQEGSYSWSDESLSMSQSETTSDQSDVESRIQALKDELRNRKSVAYQLKREQKKRHKAKLKAQEASLVKQLETYDEFIKKTEAELSQVLEVAPTAKPQIKTPSFVTEKPKIKPPPLHRPEMTRTWKSLTDSEHCRELLESTTEDSDTISLSEKTDSSYTKKSIEGEIQTEEPFRVPSPALRAPQKVGVESGDSLDSCPSLAVLYNVGNLSKTHCVSQKTFEDATSHDTHVSANRSIVQEEVVSVKSGDSKQSVTHTFSGRANTASLDTKQKSCLPVSLKTSAYPEIGLAVTCVQDGKKIPKQEESYRDEKYTASSQSSQKQDKTLLSEEQPVCTEPLYSNVSERSLSRKHWTDDRAPHTEYYHGDFETSVSSLGKGSKSYRERPWSTKTPRSRSASIGSDEEGSECPSDKALTVTSSIHSEGLMILKLPAELMKSKESSDVKGESAHLDSSLQASSSKTEEEENTLEDFSTGDRVVASNIHCGTLRFKGLTNSDKTYWAAIELDKCEGKNNGTYEGIKYVVCNEKHGIFAPPQRISQSSGGLMDTKEHSFSTSQLDHNHKGDQKDREGPREEEEENEGETVSEKSLQDKSQRGPFALESSIVAGDYLKLSAPKSQTVAPVEEALAVEQVNVKSLRFSGEDRRLLAASMPDALSETSTVAVEGALHGIIHEKWKHQQPSWQEYREKSESLSLGVSERSTALHPDLFKKERSQLEVTLRFLSHRREKSKDQQEKVGLLMDGFLQAFVKDTVSQLLQIRKVRNEKIRFSNQELAAVQEQKLASGNLLSILRLSFQLDDDEGSSPSLPSRPESPLFGAIGQKELAKRLAESEHSQAFLSVLDYQDWFDEEFGLSSRELLLKQAEEPAVLPKTEPPKGSPKPCEELLAVPYTAKEVEVLVHESAEELWKCKELEHDLQAALFPRERRDSSAISRAISKQN